MKKLEMIRARLPVDVEEVQANAHNQQQPETMDDQAGNWTIDPLIVQFPYDETRQLGIVDYGIHFLVLSCLPSCRDVVMLIF